jgi:hypothetical protein
MTQFHAMRLTLFAAITGALFICACAAAPQTQPTDPTLDWLLSHATTAPAPSDDALPTTAPAVLKSADSLDDESRNGSLLLSDGRTLKGKLSTTLGQPIRLWDADKQQYQDLPFSLIKSIEVRVISEQQSPEWKFKESGSDIKEFSGRTYPTRQTDYTITLTDDTTFTGAVAAPIYLDTPDGQKIFILHKTDRGNAGQSLGDLVYVKSVRFEDGK